MSQSNDTLFEELDLPNREKCGSCKYLEVTKDAYGTGDSPTLLECNCTDLNECDAIYEHKS